MGTWTRGMAILALLQGLGACVLQSATAERTLNTTLQPGSALVVKTKNGAVDIRVEDRADVTIHSNLRTTGRTRSDAEDRLEEVRIEVEARDGALYIEPRFPRGSAFEDSCSFTIRSPAVAGVSVTTSNGEVTVRGASGDAVIETSNGAVKVFDHQGSVTVGTSNGGVRLENVGGPVTADTSNGSIVFVAGGTFAQAFHLESSNGGIDVLLPADATGRVDASTSNGIVSVEGFHPEPGGRKDSREVVFSESGPTSTIETSNGSIRIRRAD